MDDNTSILLLGGSGFIGKNISEQLSSQYSFLTPNHQELDLLNEKDVKGYFSSHKIDVVIHGVNIGGTRKDPTPPNMFYDNLRMFFNVARCSSFYKKMIFLGSGAEYDKRQSLVNIKENDFDQEVPVDHYGYYKYLCSKYIEKSKNIINLRVFGIYGKYEDYTLRFISNTMVKKINNLPLTINQNVEFDYVYINDFVRIVDYFIKNKVKHSFYNIGTDEHVSLVSLADRINSLSDTTLPIHIKKEGKGNSYTCDASRLRKELGNFNFTPLSQTLKELFTWYEENTDIKDKNSLQQEYSR